MSRLVDIAGDFHDPNEFASTLRPQTEDFFDTFVDSILQREVREKWIYCDGDVSRPLLSSGQHHDLLSRLAEEMWTSRTDSLSKEVCDLIAELFCESQKLTNEQSRQVQERLTQHALIVPAQGTGGFAFDHEEFRNYFLGEALCEHLRECRWPEVRRILRPARLPLLALDVAARRAGAYVKPSEVPVVISGDGMGSYTRENCGALVARLLDRNPDRQVVRGLSFPDGILSPRSLKDVTFIDCYFQPTALTVGDVSKCCFENCTFERIDFMDRRRFDNVTIAPCEGVRAITFKDQDLTVYDPSNIESQLALLGIRTAVNPVEERPTAPVRPPDQAIVAVQKALRAFMRVGFINENTFRLRLGKDANAFFSVVGPLAEVGAIVKLQFRGGGVQERFRLGRPLAEIERALAASGGNFDRFLALLRGGPHPV